MTSYDAYQKAAAEWQAEFARNKRQFGSKIQCRKGCNDCCHHLFQITELEAAYISRAVKELPPEDRARLKARAREYLNDRAALLAKADVPEAWGRLPPPGTRLACPALEDGACRIYSHRPLICQKYGIPLHNPRKPDQLFACELNFQPGEEIDVTELVQIQTALHNHWADIQAEYNSRGGRRDTRPLTVARAILEDFESCLPE
jgi:Fe-S-cluster containining protein